MRHDNYDPKKLKCSLVVKLLSDRLAESNATIRALMR